jgi:hypothetical protein
LFSLLFLCPLSPHCLVVFFLSSPPFRCAVLVRL